MLAGFIIFLREGTEASIIVAILCSYLERTGRRRDFRAVFFGVGLAALLAAAGGVAAYLTVRTYAGSRVQTIFETGTYAVAVVVLTYMTFWMRAHARTMSGELARRAERRERFGIGVLAFQAVGREGLESAVFTLAIVFAAGPKLTLLGGLVGLVCATAISLFVFRLGRRLNFSVFFTTVGALLMVFAAGLVADIVENLEQLGWVHVLGGRLWDTSHQLAEGSALGDVFHSLFGYADRPTVLQLLAYLAYAMTAVGAFVALGRRDAHARPDTTRLARHRSEQRPRVEAS